MEEPRHRHSATTSTRCARLLAAPSRDWNVVKQIFADPWEPFPRAHPRSQTASYDGLVAKMLACGHPEKMGYIEYRCWQCGQGKHLVAMRCKSSLCWRCAQVTVDNGVSQVSTMLHEGVMYRHIILTVAVELLVRVLACLAEGLGIRATARVFEVDPNTVLRWLGEAAEQLQAFSRYVLCEVHVKQVQLDELYAVLRALKAGEISADDALERLEPSRPWVWTAIDPMSKLLLAMEVGPRTVEMAQRVVHQVVSVLAPGGVPAWFSDGFKGYLPAILGHFGWWTHPERRQDKGPWPKPRWMPLPGLLYGQLVKQYRRKRLVGVKHRVVFGTRDAIAQVLAAWGWKINTSFVERLNLDLRQRVAAIGRRVNTLCQGEDSMRQQLALFQVYHNFVLPHASLREALAAPIPTNGSGSAKLWWPCTPAMAAGLTDHVWSLQEVLLLRVPPWPQPHVR